MKLLEKLNTLERLDQLIRMKATGTPKELARKLEISERQVYNLLNDLKVLGAEVVYNKHRQCYEYSCEICFDFRLVVKRKESVGIKGGKIFSNFFGNCKNFAAAGNIFEISADRGMLKTLYMKE